MVQPEGTLAKSVTQHGLIINHRAGQTGLDMVEEYRYGIFFVCVE